MIVYFSGTHLAYNVVSLPGIVVNSNGVVNSASIYHPSKVLPTLVGSTGLVIGVSNSAVISSISLPPFSSNVIVYVPIVVLV